MSVLDKVKSIFKKDSEDKASPTGRGGPKIWPMPAAMQREFEKGVKYNMRVVIRGMRKTGKSSLLARLHGHAFPEAYTPTPEISAATIRYESPDNEEGTKVELWDVVDTGISPTSSSKGAINVLADASTIDVYRGCNCVVFMVDVTRRETLDYALRECHNVPRTAAILIALNFRDAPKPHAVSEREVDEACRKLPRVSTPMIFLASQGSNPDRSLSASATWVSISCRNNQGVELLRNFFDIPVTMVRLQSLETQMKGYYERIELHQAELLRQRAELLFEEKERLREDASPPSSPPKAAGQATTVTVGEPPNHTKPPATTTAPPRREGQSINVMSLPPPPPRVQSAPQPAAPLPQKKPPTASVKNVVASKPSEPEDPSKISNDFFGDVSSDDDDDNNKDQSSSSSDEEEYASPARRGPSLPSQRRGSVQGNSPLSKDGSPTIATTATSSSASLKGSAGNPAPPPVQENIPPVSHTNVNSAPALPSVLRNTGPILKDEDLQMVGGDKVTAGFFDDDDSDGEEQAVAEPKSSGDETDSDSASRARGKANVSSAAVPVVKQPAPPPTATVVSTTETGMTFSDDDEDEEIEPKTSAKKTAASSSSDEEPQKVVSRRVAPQPRVLDSTRQSAGRRAPPAPPVASTTRPAAAPAVSVDINALLAQMQSAMIAAPVVGSDEEEEKHDKKEKKSKRSHRKSGEEKESRHRNKSSKSKSRASDSEGDE